MATLEEMIAALEKLGEKDVSARIAEKASKKLATALEITLAAGTSPEGAQWAPKKKDGGRPYEKAATKLSVKSYGNLIRAVITGPEAYGHFGARRAAVRPMIPDAGAAIPANVSNAILEAAQEVFDEA